MQAETALGEEEVCRLAAERGVRVSGISQYRFGDSAEKMLKERFPVLLLGYGKLGEQEIRQGVEMIGEVIAGKR